MNKKDASVLVVLEDWDTFNYQQSMAKRDAAIAKSRQVLTNNDIYMFKFWSNASREFEKRATEQLSETLKRKKKVVLYDRFA